MGGFGEAIAGCAAFGAFVGFGLGLFIAIPALWQMDMVGFAGAIIVAFFIGPIAGAIAGVVAAPALLLAFLILVLIGKILYYGWPVLILAAIITAIVFIIIDWHNIIEFIANIPGGIAEFWKDAVRWVYELIDFWEKEIL